MTENLGAHTTLTLTAKLQTNGNEAGDLYGNIAHSWKQGDARTGSNLTSNQVWTRVVGREISGLVWEDVNQDGVRNKVGDEDVYKRQAVYSKGGRTNSAYDSGTWSVEAAGNGVENGKTTADITDTGKGVTYTFTVKGFDFDFDNFTFPSESAGNAGKMDWLAPNYIGSFSAGHIQVLQKYPENPKADASPEITAEIKNLKTNSMSGEEKAGEATAVTSEIGGINDNKNTSRCV